MSSGRATEEFEAFFIATAPLVRRYAHRMVDSATDLGFQYSIYPRQDHEAALGAHYSEIGEALVGSDPATTAMAAMRRTVRMLRRELKQRRRARAGAPPAQT